MKWGSLMMQSKSINRQFYKFVFPAMLTMLLSSFYVIVDGFFVGRATQDVGLAAIGLIWPIAALLIALGCGIGTGGAVMMSACNGEKDFKNAEEYKAVTLVLLILVSLLMTFVLVAASPTLIRWLGAEGEIYQAALEYMIIISWGGSMQIMATGITPLIRNCGLSIQAMVIMCVGLVANILLDALFTMVIPWGLAGAAFATTLAQAITVILSFVYLQRSSVGKFCRHHFVMSFNKVKHILVIAISPFGLSLMPSLVTVFVNWQCLHYGQDIAVSAYSVINYFTCCVYMLLSGIGEGLQPLISYYHGAKNEELLKILKKKALRLGLVVSTFFFALSFFLGQGLAELFSTSAQTAQLVSQALPIFCGAFWFVGVSKLYSSYFYARKNNKYSNLLVYLDPLIFTPLSLLILPLLFQLQGVWFSIPVAQILVFLLLCFLLKFGKRKENVE